MLKDGVSARRTATGCGKARLSPKARRKRPARMPSPKRMCRVRFGCSPHRHSVFPSQTKRRLDRCLRNHGAVPNVATCLTGSPLVFRRRETQSHLDPRHLERHRPRHRRFQLVRSELRDGKSEPQPCSSTRVEVRSCFLCSQSSFAQVGPPPEQGLNPPAVQRRPFCCVRPSSRSALSTDCVRRTAGGSC